MNSLLIFSTWVYNTVQVKLISRETNTFCNNCSDYAFLRQCNNCECNLGPFQTSNFACAESNANERKQQIFLICIRFGTCKVRRLKRALLYFSNTLNLCSLLLQGRTIIRKVLTN